MERKRGCYSLKTYTNEIYSWCPDKSKKTNNKPISFRFKGCNATPNSQGDDWNCGYVYEVLLTPDVNKRIAYVECDYVK